MGRADLVRAGSHDGERNVWFVGNDDECVVIDPAGPDGELGVAQPYRSCKGVTIRSQTKM